MKLELMQDLYALKLQQTLQAEQEFIQTLPEVAAAASTPELREGFEKHAEQTRGQVDRLQRCLSGVGVPQTKTAPLAFQALMTETREILESDLDPEMANAVLVGAGQKMEHLEIACYGELIGMARALGRRQDAELLEQNLSEERRMEQQLAATAENVLMEAAATEETL